MAYKMMVKNEPLDVMKLFKPLVVSTGADATNSAESFIDNVTVEYRLDKSATRYVRAFYDRGTQDPFEGQLMKTGAGLVLRRKTDRLGELFIFRTNRKKH